MDKSMIYLAVAFAVTFVIYKIMYKTIKTSSIRDFLLKNERYNDVKHDNILLLKKRTKTNTTIGYIIVIIQSFAISYITGKDSLLYFAIVGTIFLPVIYFGNVVKFYSHYIELQTYGKIKKIMLNDISYISFNKTQCHVYDKTGNIAIQLPAVLYIDIIKFANTFRIEIRTV